jgi:hypothetical protein
VWVKMRSPSLSRKLFMAWRTVTVCNGNVVRNRNKVQMIKKIISNWRVAEMFDFIT